MMKNFSGYAAAVAAMVAMVAISLLLAAVPPIAKAQAPPPAPPNCSQSELSPCFSAFLFGSAPTPECCQKLKQQQPCFCVYASDPNLASFVNSTNARRIAASCNVTYPTNCP